MAFHQSSASPEGGQGDVVQMLETLYCSADPHARRQADIWLRHWQKSSEAWALSMEMLLQYAQTPAPAQSPVLSDEAVYFLSQTLRTKTMFDFHQLPAASHEVLCSQVIRLLQSFTAPAPHADASAADTPASTAGPPPAAGPSANAQRDRHRAAVTQLSLCLADLALQTADKWETPVQVILQAFPLALPSAAGGAPGLQPGDTRGHTTALLLLLLRHLAEESTSRRVMADETVRRQHLANMAKAASTVMQTLLDLRQRVRDTKQSLETKSLQSSEGEARAALLAAIAINDSLLRAILSCWRVWLPFLQPLTAGEGDEAARQDSAGLSLHRELGDATRAREQQASLALVFSDCLEVLASPRQTPASAASYPSSSGDEDAHEAAASCVLRLLKSVTSATQELRSRLLRLQKEVAQAQPEQPGAPTLSSAFSPPAPEVFAHALRETETRLKTAEAFELQLLQEILARCVGPLRGRLLAALQRSEDEASGAFEDDFEAMQTLTTLARVYAGVGIFLIPALVRRSHKDAQLQELVHLLMKISESPRTRGMVSHGLEATDAGADDEEGEEEALLVIEEPMRFWMKLAEAAHRAETALAACAVRGETKGDGAGGASQKASLTDRALDAEGPLPEDARQSIDALKEVYTHLLRECLLQLTMPKRVADSALSGDYDAYRRALLDCVEDCALLLSAERGSLVAIDHLQQLRQRQEAELQRMSSLSPSAAELQQRQERLLEGALVGLAKLCSLDTDFAVLKQHLQAPLGAVSEVLGTETFPAHSLPLLHTTVFARIAAIDLLKQLLVPLVDDAASLQQALQMLVRQLLTQPKAAAGGDRAEDERQAMIQNLHVNAARAVRQLCIAANASALHPPLVNELVNLTIALANVNADEDVHMFVLEGVSAVASKMEDTATFLSVLEALCKPAIAGLQQSETNEAAICQHLDCLAVILRDAVCPGASAQSAASPGGERHLRVAAFITSSLWPLLRAQLEKLPSHQRIVEKSLRCLKHAVRCAGDGFKPLLPDFLALLEKNAQLCLHCTYLYAAEWLAMQFGKDEQYQQALMHLFRQLSTHALKAIQEQGPNVDACCDLVEDCYGMVNRYIRYCPLLVSLSPSTIQQALVAARSAMYVQQREAAQVVFIFLDSCAFVCDEQRPVEPLSNALVSIVVEHLPPLVDEAFRLLMEAPPSYVVGLIEGFLITVVQVFRHRAEQWIARGLSVLPPAVLPSEAMKTELLAKLCRPETGGVSEAVEGLAYR
ncbi:conserved hypothetical protein [Neospora caninum Liverpool]|nr:conserved hypothetical protein [Neospora caninum Liverpool]CBZ50961.1 conserved hypothetical protein [Neospora caninum Liverpool]|eukprot:XP_003880994.1 conserved hypothetical protein [Neospora caninum Liverpool]